jgi:hypothetical protein
VPTPDVPTGIILAEDVVQGCTFWLSGQPIVETLETVDGNHVPLCFPEPPTLPVVVAEPAIEVKKNRFLFVMEENQIGMASRMENPFVGRVGLDGAEVLPEVAGQQSRVTHC